MDIQLQSTNGTSVYERQYNTQKKKKIHHLTGESVG